PSRSRSRRSPWWPSCSTASPRGAPPERRPRLRLLFAGRGDILRASRGADGRPRSLRGPHMSTIEDLRATLTGPGGAFEVITDSVNGIEMLVYKDRMKALREIIAMAALRGDEQTFLAYGDREYGFARFVALANSVSAAPAERHGIATGDRVAVLSANNPEWCLTFWGTVDLGGILVRLNGWSKTAAITLAI